MKTSTLRCILKSATAHPSKKLDNHQISEIYSRCVSKEDLGDVLVSQYFSRVAWRHFHADVTNSHLELILQLVSYEFEVLGEKTCLELMQMDPLKFEALVSRSLSSTLSYRKQDIRLQACVFLFVRVLLMTFPTTLSTHPIYGKWCISMLKSYTETLSDTSEESPTLVLLLNCFLHFCMACVMSPSTELTKEIQATWLPFHFMQEPHDFATRRLASLVWLQIRPKQIKFTTFLRAIEVMNLHGRFPSVKHASSRLEVSRENFSNDLSNLSTEELRSLVGHLGHNMDETSDVLIPIICDLTLGSEIDFDNLCRFQAVTENDVFDLFQKIESLPFVPDVTIPSLGPCSPQLIHLIKAQEFYKYLSMANERAVNVFERLTITDPSTEKGIKGTSKYFSLIENVNVSGSMANISFKNKTVCNGLKKGDNVLIIEIEKPNRHGGSSRVIKYGVASCFISKVLNKSSPTSVNFSSRGFEKPATAIIILPSFIDNDIQELDWDDLSLSLTNLLDSDAKHNQCLTIDCISGDTLESLGGELIQKKQKVDEHHSNQTAPQYKLANCEITVQDAKSFSLTEDLSEALLAMLQEKRVQIKNATGDTQITLVNFFLRNLSINKSDESCLVVLPTKAAVDLFPIDKALDTICFKFDSNNLSVLQKIEVIKKNLDRVSEIAKSLGLDDYDFSSSIRNALMLYHSHVEPRWTNFLQTISKENFSHYPFSSIQSTTFEKAMPEIVDHFAGVRSLFSELEQALPLDRFLLDKLRPNDYLQIGKFFASRSKFNIVAEEDLGNVVKKFDNIVLHSLSILPRLKGGFHKIVLIGGSTVEWGKQIHLSSSMSRNEISQLIDISGVEVHSSFNPGFRHNVQHIKVPYSKDTTHIEEALFCVHLYQYMRLVGYPWWNISIVVKSAQMKALIHEILHDEKINEVDLPSDETERFQFGWPIIQSFETCSSCDYLIASCCGKPNFVDYQKLASSSIKGLYLVSESVSEIPYKITSGNLEVASGEFYKDSSRHATRFKSVKSANQLHEHVKKMQENKKSG